MDDSWVSRVMDHKGVDKAKVAQQVLRDPKLVRHLILGVKAEKPSVKYGCAKVLLIISEAQPELLYAQIDVFRELLTSEKNILRWNAIQILANLARVDRRNKLDQFLDAYLAPVDGPCMITATNTIKGAAIIAKWKPRLAESIAARLFAVEKATYATPECRNIALARTLEAFDGLLKNSERTSDQRRKLVNFAQRHLHNPRSSTRKKAERFVKKWKET